MKSFAIFVSLLVGSVSALAFYQEQISFAEEETPKQYSFEGIFATASKADPFLAAIDHESNQIKMSLPTLNVVYIYDGTKFHLFEKNPKTGYATCRIIKLEGGDTEIPHFKKDIGEFRRTDFAYGQLLDVYFKATTEHSPETTTYLDASTGYLKGSRAILGGGNFMSIVVKIFVPLVDSGEFKVPQHLNCTESALNEGENLDAFKMLTKM